MKALSVRQPWASAIIHCGKDIENRTRRIHYRGPLLIHASKHKPTKKELVGFADFIFCVFGDREPGFCGKLIASVMRESGPRGGIIGQVEVLYGCVTKSESPWFCGPYSPWFCGPYGLVLANPKPLPFREYKGRLGLFEVE